MQFQNDLNHETEQLNNLICKLHQYYQDVKTKRQLNWMYKVVFGNLQFYNETLIFTLIQENQKLQIN